MLDTIRDAGAAKSVFLSVCVIMPITLSSVLMLAITVIPAFGEALNVAPGRWQVTTFLRDFEVSPDGQKEITTGGSEPTVQTRCFTVDGIRAELPIQASRKSSPSKKCSSRNVSATSQQIDVVTECPTLLSAPSYVMHILAIASTPKTLVEIFDTTWTTPMKDGHISRSAIYVRGKWLSKACGD